MRGQSVIALQLPLTRLVPWPAVEQRIASVPRSPAVQGQDLATRQAYQALRLLLGMPPEGWHLGGTNRTQIRQGVLTNARRCRLCGFVGSFVRLAFPARMLKVQTVLRKMVQSPRQWPVRLQSRGQEPLLAQSPRNVRTRGARLAQEAKQVRVQKLGPERVQMLVMPQIPLQAWQVFALFLAHQ